MGNVNKKQKVKALLVKGIKLKVSAVAADILVIETVWENQNRLLKIFINRNWLFQDDPAEKNIFIKIAFAPALIGSKYLWCKQNNNNNTRDALVSNVWSAFQK